MHCFAGMDNDDEVEIDLLQIPLNDYWHLGANVKTLMW